MWRPKRTITTPAIFPRRERCSISNDPMAVADAPREMKTSEKPITNGH
jgi:hypothetical protein